MLSNRHLVNSCLVNRKAKTIGSFTRRNRNRLVFLMLVDNLSKMGQMSLGRPCRISAAASDARLGGWNAGEADLESLSSRTAN
jgi:hypothetical protein